MKANHSAKGFTRPELLLSIGVGAATMAVTYAAATGPIASGVQLEATAKTGRAMYNWMQAYANDNNEQFPATKGASNEAFRELFVKRYLDDETAFAIPGDAWLNKAPGGAKKPDKDIGPEPKFPKAVAPGECSWAYVTGLGQSSSSNLPILATAFSEKIGVYAWDKAAKGGIFAGRSAWVSVGGSARMADPEADMTVAMKKDGKSINIYSKEWGTKPENVRNPAE